MRTPRDVSGAELIVLLRRKYGYSVLRQRGSHMQLRTNYLGQPHMVTVPRHNPVRVGTLNTILDRVARYLGITRDELLVELFGN